MTESSRNAAIFGALIAWALTWFILPPCLGASTRGVQTPPSQADRIPTIKEVRITRQGDLVIVTIEADGALPAPQVGQLDSPPRVFLDFPGVNAGTTGASGQEDAVVLRVRVALFTREPRVTRAVIDLSEKQPIRTEGEERDAGRFKVLIGAVAPEARTVTVPLVQPSGEKPPSSQPTEPPGRPEILPPPRPVEPLPRPVGSTPETGTALPTAGAPSVSLPTVSSRPAAAPLPPRDVERYRGQAGATLTRFRNQRALLAAIDRQDPKPPEGLAAAREEFSAVLRSLTSIKPPDTIRPTHDMLIRSASFALMAATLRDDAGVRAEAEKLRNAGSAAAGALLLLDRVCAEIGCPPASELVRDPSVVR
jgi:hypothetical protein